jgi:hypothetical protein
MPLALMGLLIGIPTAAGGAAPIQPNPYSQSAQLAYALANTSTQVTVESLSFAFNVTFTGPPCGTGCVILATTPVSTGSPTAFGGTVLSALTTITPITAPSNPGNIRLSCTGAGTVNYNYQSSIQFSQFCSVVSFQWAGIHFVVPEGKNVGYLIARQVTMRLVVPVRWNPVTSCTSVSSILYTPGSKQFYSSYVTQQWNVTAVTYAVGLPLGNWNLASATFFDANASTFYSSNFFAVSSRSFLAQWQNYPSSVTIGSLGANFTQRLSTYKIAICSIQGNAGTKNQTTPNGTVPPPPSTFPQAITLTLGPFGQVTPGNYSASATWTNNLSAPFAGEFILIATWITQVGQASVLVNGQPLTATQYALTNTSVFIYPGSVIVQNGTAAKFTVDFEVAPTYAFSSAVFLINGYPVTTSDLWGIAVLAAAGLIAVLRFTRYYNGPAQLPLATLSFGLAIWAALVL